MEAYLDNSATTKCAREVVETVVKAMQDDYGNPSSKHMKGVDAEQYIKQAAATIAKSLKCQEKELIFTSGGTESNNMAIIGTVMANKRRGNHVIVSSVEHSSVKEPFNFLEEQGYRVTYLPVDSQGRVSLDALREALDSETILVSVMYANNEIGTVEPVEEIGQIVKQFNPAIVYHVDAIQAFGKYRIYPKKLGIDMLSVSSHKIHGPKGVGFLYISENAKVQPQILGGGQQAGMRSGTDNVPGIAGLGVAAQMVYTGFEEKIEHMYQLKERLAAGFMKLPDVLINGMELREGAPQILSASFLGVRSEVLLHTLEEKGIYVSAGSACSSHKKKAIGTLSAMGMEAAQKESTLRFSFSEENTFERSLTTAKIMEEVDYCLEVVGQVLPMLRRYSRR